MTIPRKVLTVAALALAVTLSVWPLAARAGDLDSAKHQLDALKVDLDSGSWDSIDQDIKSTEEFLDGLPAADRDPIQKELDGLKIKAAAGLKDHRSKAVVEGATRDLDSAAENMNSDPAGASTSVTDALTKLNSDDATKNVDPAQLEKLKSRAASLKKMTDVKALNAKLEFANQFVKQLDDAMAANPFKDAKSDEDLTHASQQIESLTSQVRGAIDGLPATDPRVKAINDKLATYEKQVQVAAGGVMAGQAADQIAHQWSSEQEYFAGWDQEKQGPTWEDYNSRQSDEMSDLLMPKTVELLTRMPQWFQEDAVKTPAEQYKDNPMVKQTMADAHKTYDAAALKLHNAFNVVLAGAEKIETPKDQDIRNKADTLADRADMWLKGTSYHDGDVARAKALSLKWNGKVAGDAAAQQATLNKMTADATAAWPAIAAGMHPVDGFTPDKVADFTGKLIHLKGNNRWGWDYFPGPYKFAQDINGLPVGAKFDPAIAAAVEDAVKKTGQELPDEDWDIYAIVEGPGSIQAHTSSEGKVKIDGEEVGTVTAEGHKGVPCAVVRIVALHVGPVAVGTNASSGLGGLMGSPNGPGGWIVWILRTLVHLVEFALCLIAAALILLKARPALAAQVATATHTAPGTPVLPNAITGYIGLALLVLGALWLLAKLIIGDLFPAASLMLAGLLIAAEWLSAKKLLPPSLLKSLTPMALPLAGAVSLFGFLHLFLAGWYLF